MVVNGNTNGTNGWLKWLVATLYSIIILAIVTLSTNVIANDQNTRDREDKIKICHEIDIRRLETLIHVNQLKVMEAQNEITQSLVRIETKLENNDGNRIN